MCGIAERIFDDHHFVIVDYWVEVRGDATAGDDAEAVCWACRTDLDALPLVPKLTEFLAEHAVLGRLS